MSRRGRPSDIGSAECNMSDYPVHIDPLDPDTPTPDKSMWTPLRRDAWASQEMEAFRESLRIRGLPDIRSAVLAQTPQPVSRPSAQRRHPPHPRQSGL